MRDILSNLLLEYEGRIEAAESYASQVYANIAVTEAPEIAGALRGRFEARLVTVFAEDRLATDGCFYIY